MRRPGATTSPATSAASAAGPMPSRCRSRTSARAAGQGAHHGRDPHAAPAPLVRARDHDDPQPPPGGARGPPAVRPLRRHDRRGRPPHAGPRRPAAAPQPPAGEQGRPRARRAVPRSRSLLPREALPARSRRRGAHDPVLPAGGHGPALVPAGARRRGADRPVDRALPDRGGEEGAQGQPGGPAVHRAGGPLELAPRGAANRRPGPDRLVRAGHDRGARLRCVDTERSAPARVRARQGAGDTRGGRHRAQAARGRPGGEGWSRRLPLRAHRRRSPGLAPARPQAHAVQPDGQLVEGVGEAEGGGAHRPRADGPGAAAAARHRAGPAPGAGRAGRRAMVRAGGRSHPEDRPGADRGELRPAGLPGRPAAGDRGPAPHRSRAIDGEPGRGGALAERRREGLGGEGAGRPGGLLPALRGAARPADGGVGGRLGAGDVVLPGLPGVSVPLDPVGGEAVREEPAAGAACSGCASTPRR